jgi:subtilisin family serine protease
MISNSGISLRSQLWRRDSGRTTRADRPRPSARVYRIEALEARCLLDAGASFLAKFTTLGPSNAPIVLNQFGAKETQTLPGGVDVFTISNSAALPSVLSALRADVGVQYAEVNSKIAAQTVPNDTYFSNQWGLNQTNNVDIDGPEAWSISTGNPATTVAVTDTGIDYTNPDLYLNVWLNQGEIPPTIKSNLVETDGDGIIDFHDLNSLDANGNPVLNSSGVKVNAWATHDYNNNGYIDAGDLLADPNWMNGLDNDGDGFKNDIIGWNFVANNNNPLDDNAHGTEVSGIVGATSNNSIGVAGVDWNAHILPVKILDSTGSGLTSNAINGVNYAAAHGARVINASWGGAPYTSSLATAISSAGSSGSVFVAAAGNNAASNDTTPFYPASYREPNEISVAAVTSTGTLASFSDYGATTVDLGAPGQTIETTIPGGYGASSGTSEAAPFVSGVAALLAGLHPTYTASQVVQVVDGNTKPLSSLSGKTISGGMVDAYNVLNAPTLSGTPTAPANLVASAASSSSSKLTWSSSTGASSYLVDRSPNGSSSWTQVGTTNSSTTSFTDTGQSPSTTYFYEVLASNSVGNSPPSNVSSDTTNGASAPAAPTGLKATAPAYNKVSLSWTASTGATSYVIQRSTNGTTWSQIGTATSASYTDPTVVASTTYYYRGDAVNSAGSSAFSSSVSVTTPRKK